jgi:chemotaxis signal transduction protein
MNLRGTIAVVVICGRSSGLWRRVHGVHGEYRADGGDEGDGLIVDAVSDVLNIPKADMQATPDFGRRWTRGSSAGWRRRGQAGGTADIDRALGEVDLPGGASNREPVGSNGHPREAAKA